MTISLNDLVSVGALLGSLYAIYSTIKKTGAAKMKTDQEIKQLTEEVGELKTRLAVEESCNAKNDKAIGVIQSDIEWIKTGINEIKAMIQKRDA